MKQLLLSGGFSLDLSWITDFVIEAIIIWISNLVGSALDLFGIGLTGILSLDLTILEQLFTFLVDAYDVIRGFAMILMWAITIFQLVKAMLGPISDAEEPLRLVVRSAIFTLGILMAKEITRFAVGIAKVPYEALENVAGSTGTISFSSTQLSLGQMLGGILDELIAMIIAVVLMIIIAWNYFKLCLEAVIRYVMLGFLVYTSPLAFSMGSAQVTKNVFSAWCKMVGSQIILMMANVFFLRGFAYAYALPIGSFGQILTNQGHPQSAVGATALWCFFLIAWLKIGQGIDSYLNRLGLSVAQTGGNMASELILSTHMLTSSFHAVRQGLKEARNNLGGTQGEKAVGGTPNAATAHGSEAVQSGQRSETPDKNNQVGAGKAQGKPVAIGQTAETGKYSGVMPVAGGTNAGELKSSAAIGKTEDMGGSATSIPSDTAKIAENHTDEPQKAVGNTTQTEAPVQEAFPDMPQNAFAPGIQLNDLVNETENMMMGEGTEANAVGMTEGGTVVTDNHDQTEPTGVETVTGGGVEEINASIQEDGVIRNDSAGKPMTESKTMEMILSAESEGYPQTGARTGKMDGHENNLGTVQGEVDGRTSFGLASEKAITGAEMNHTTGTKAVPVGGTEESKNSPEMLSVPAGQPDETSLMGEPCMDTKKSGIPMVSGAGSGIDVISNRPETVNPAAVPEPVMQEKAFDTENSLTNGVGTPSEITPEGVAHPDIGNEAPHGLVAVANELENPDAQSPLQSVSEQRAVGEENRFAETMITPTRQPGISRLDLSSGGMADVYAAEQYQEPVAPHTTLTDRDGQVHYVMQPTANYTMYDGLTPVQHLFKDNLSDGLDLSRAKNPDFSNISDGRFKVFGGTVNNARVKLNAYDTARYHPEGVEGKDYFLRQDPNGATWAFSTKRLKKYPTPKKRRK